MLHPLLAARWSPTRFDAHHHMSDEEVELLLEAARWAPSAGNSQPWSFIVARRGDETHARIVRHLAASSGSEPAHEPDGGQPIRMRRELQDLLWSTGPT